MSPLRDRNIDVVPGLGRGGLRTISATRISRLNVCYVNFGGGARRRNFGVTSTDGFHTMALSQFLRANDFRTPGRRLRQWWSGHSGFSKTATIFAWVGGIILLLLLIAIVAAFFIDEPLRRRMEARLNSTLQGYTVRIGKLDFHPIGLSLDLEDATITQNDNPEPPVAHIPNLTASVDWRAILSGRVVADFEFDSPKLYINRKQAKKEIEDETPIEERGWQHALQEIYPLKINHFVIYNGELTYVDEGPFRPLELTAVNLRAENIRNIASEEGVYPSSVHIDAVVFGKGKLLVDGNADFLAEPHVSFKTDLSLENIALDYFKPLIERYNFTVQKGTLSAHGNMEYAANTKYINIGEVRVRDVNGEYINRTAESAPAKAAKKVDQAAKEYSDAPTLAVNVDKVFINGRLGFLNAARNPQYRIFWDPCEVQISNFTNQSKDGAMVGRLTGLFMGSGKTKMDVTARPNKKGPDIDLRIAIEDTDMKSMNDLFRSYGNFDVVAGRFSFFSEITVRSGDITGYVKPLFYEMDVYDRRQDKEKGVFRKLYEGAIGGLSWLFQNTPRDEVATTIPISGKLSDPQTSTWETIIGLVQNAFFKAILPGFEREAAAPRKKP
jgi:hypothetical protein